MSSPPSQPAFTRFNPVQPGAAGMKAAATGLLLVMAAIFMPRASSRLPIRGSAM